MTNYLMITRHVGPIVCACLLTACGSSSIQNSDPDSVTNYDPSKPSAWFCEAGEDDTGWKCVQDESLVKNPKPSRIPEPISKPQIEPVANTYTDITSPTAATPQTTAQSQPAPVAKAEPQTPSASSEESATRSDVPKHIALSYRPEKPVSILDLPGDFWAVQLVSLSQKETLENYAKEHQLRGMSAARVWSQEQFFYVLILGIYDSYDKAKEASTNLPPPFDETPPWIRSVASLQKAMLEADAKDTSG